MTTFDARADEIENAVKVNHQADMSVPSYVGTKRKRVSFSPSPSLSSSSTTTTRPPAEATASNQAKLNKTTGHVNSQTQVGGYMLVDAQVNMHLNLHRLQQTNPYYYSMHTPSEQPSVHPLKRAPARVCIGDQRGPRVRQVFREFQSWTKIPGHMIWLHHLRASCEQQGCPLTECRRFDYCAVHGARSLCDSMISFLSYYVPRNLRIESDIEWRQLLVALRCFHLFCVRRQYVEEDEVLMAALYKLRRFNLSVIPTRLAALCTQSWWDMRAKEEEEEEEQRRARIHGQRRAEDDGDGILVSKGGKIKTDGENSPTGGISNREHTQHGGEGGPNGCDVQERKVDKEEEGLDEFGYCRYFAIDELTLTVDEVMVDGWMIKREDEEGSEWDGDGEAFLHLPPKVARMGMKGMTLSGIQLGFRNGLWRPVLRDDGSCVTSAYPPDELFYY